MNRSPAPRRAAGPARRQRGGFLLGFIVGGVLGVLVALAVALYVNKVPIPFVDKVPHRSAQQDAAEAERNRNWDPNGPLSGKPAVRPPGAASPGPGAGPAPSTSPAAALPAAPAQAAASAPPAAAADTGPVQFFVQVGAFAKPEDAEQQRAKLAILGYEARVSARDQAGRTMHRVRLGPFDRRADAEIRRDGLAEQGFEAALVRVQPASP